MTQTHIWKLQKAHKEMLTLPETKSAHIETETYLKKGKNLLQISSNLLETEHTQAVERTPTKWRERLSER